MAAERLLGALAPSYGHWLFEAPGGLLAPGESMKGGPRGPAPKREGERVRRNKDESGPVDKVQVAGEVGVPELDIPDAHPMVVDFYESLKESAQTRYYEPSDWQLARLTCWYMNRELKSSKPSAMMLAQITSMLNDLMVDEATRRRLRIEIERKDSSSSGGGQVVSVAEKIRQRAQSA